MDESGDGGIAAILAAERDIGVAIDTLNRTPEIAEKRKTARRLLDSLDDLERRLAQHPEDPSYRPKRALCARRRDAVNLALKGLDVFDRLRG